VFSKRSPDAGQPTKSESFDFGGAEFAPRVLGATM
jgi:altronate hydrolase